MSDSFPNSSTSLTKPRPDAQIRGTWLTITRIFWGVALLLMAGLNYTGISRYITSLNHTEFHTLLPFNAVAEGLRDLSISTETYLTVFLLRISFLILAYIIVGTVMYMRKPDQWVVLLYSLILFAMSILFTMDLFPTPEPNQGLFAFLGNLSFGALFFGFYIFPDGRFTPSWTRWLMLTWIVTSVLIGFAPNTSLDPNIWPVFLSAPLFIILIGSAPYAQIYRYRKVSSSAHRQQIKWVIFGLAINVIGFLAFWMPLNLFPDMSQVPRTAALYDLIGGTLLLGTYAVLPLSIGFALLRYRLWDIDPIINRTLVYGLLTVSVILIYIIIVGYLGSLFSSGGNWFISLVATGVIAILFQPLHQFLQKNINRWFFGERDDPYGVISRLGQSLENTLSPDFMLSTIVNTVREALKLPYAAIVVKQDGQVMDTVSAGKMNGEIHKLPIVYQQTPVGEFHLSPRAPGEAFGTTDWHLLEDLARQAGVAIQEVRLTTELQQARERLVSTREEERRRLRRDLHDGPGTQLASQALIIDAIYRQLEADPQTARDLLQKLKLQTQDAVRDIRRLVNDLRPPALDELGLIGALREGILNSHVGPQILLDAPDKLPPMPAAVEVASYRIVQEAVANVIQHAQANRCDIHIMIQDQTLHLEIDDDGNGTPANFQPRNGLFTMRERAEELGGSFQVNKNRFGGTQIKVSLPIPEIKV